MPALTPLLSPFGGLWQKPLSTKLRNQIFQLRGLQGKVQIFWDEYEVPHVFAESEADLAFAQGFVHASQRLFQMDIQSRSGGARLSEIFGARTLAIDDFFVRIGLREVTDKILRQIAENEQSVHDLNAYTDGVNAWIEQMPAAMVPSEYRILGIKPERWEPRRYAELAAAMTFNLAGRTFDLILTKYKRKFGREAVQSLFPEFLSAELEAPYAIRSAGMGLKPQKAPEEFALADRLEALPSYLIQPVESNGSNNWAVGPQKSKTGFSILANDTHLGFTLPNIWFEIQLIGPKVNAYGAGFPGGIWLLSGFSEHLGWAVTNGTTDVIDWHEAEIRRENDNSISAKLRGQWQKLRLDQQTIKVKDAKSKAIDLYWSDVGPMYYSQGSVGLFMRWTAHMGSPLLSVFQALNFSQGKLDCLRAIENFKAPIQNFICADPSSAEIVHTGVVPLRWHGQGQFVHDGEDPKGFWNGEVSFTQLPRSTTAEEGFVFSANQRPVDASYPISLGTDAENSYRARQIKRKISSKGDWTGEDFVKLQLNIENPLARSVLPLMLDRVNPTENKTLIEILRHWDFTDDKALVEPTLFFYWWRNFHQLVWSDQLGQGDDTKWPRDERLELLLRNLSADPNHADSMWVDDVETKEKIETLGDILNKSFALSLEQLKEERGPRLEDWEWGDVRPVQFRHVGRMPGFGAQVSASGGRHSISAIQAKHGPTWRMVVELGDIPKAWTATAGPTSGEPFSNRYDQGLNDWADGRYKEAKFLRSPNEGMGMKVWELDPIKD